MSDPSSPSFYNPSAQVERMREIIVGRKLARVEQRLDRLELFLESPQLSSQEAFVRVEQLEAQFEAVRDHMQYQVDQIRREIGSELANRNGEVHRLAEQIQQAALLRNEKHLQAESEGDIEQRVGSQLGQWQKNLEDFLGKRENWLIQQMRQELQQLRQLMADQLHEAEIGHQRCLHDLESKRNDCQQIPTTLQAPHEHLKLLVEQLQQKVQVMEIQHQQNQQTHQTLLSQLAQAARTLTESAASLGPLSTDCPPTTR